MPSRFHKYNKRNVMPIISRALEEDIGGGDITSLAVLPQGVMASARIKAKDNAIVCGIDTVKWAYGLLSKRIRVKNHFKDGDYVTRGTIVSEISGPALQILMGERVILNLLSYMSGIATMTRRFVDKFSRIEVMDTRKTHPGLRLLQKYAVKIGGGKNHRMGLYDQILIKDNHIDIIARAQKVSRKEAAVAAIRRAKKARKKGIKIEIEIDDRSVYEAVLEEGVDIAMLDNMPLSKIRVMAKELKRRHPGISIEVSGKLSKAHIDGLNSVKEIDRASLGRLTHSFKIVDYSMDID